MIPKKFGRYEIRDELGQGGMATVYLAYDPLTDRDVALKVLEMLSHKDRQRFFQEGRTIANLQHPNIIPIYDIGEDNGRPYLVMPYMTGGTLANRLETGPLPVAEAVHILGKIAAALDEAHAHHVIHRDVKPLNVLLDKWDQPTLSDFGIVKRLQDGEKITGSGTIGTMGYMSPEQLQGKKSIDHRSDIFALGVMLFEMLTGKIPSEVDHGFGYLKGNVPSILSFNHTLPVACQRVIEKAMAEKPEARYQSAGEMAQALKQFLTPTLGDGDQPFNKTKSTVIVGDSLRTPIKRIRETSQRISKQIRGLPRWVQFTLFGFIGILFVTTLMQVWAEGPPTTPTTTAVAVSETAVITPRLIQTTVTPSHTPSLVPDINEGDPSASTEHKIFLGLTSSVPTPTVSPTSTDVPTPTPTATVTPSPLPTTQTLTSTLTFTLTFSETLLTLTITPTVTLIPTPTPPGIIAFASNRDTIFLPPEEQKYDIYLLDLQSDSVQKVTSSVRDNIEPAWSPDGQQLAFTSYRDKDGEIYVLNITIANSTPIRYTFRSGNDGAAAWSPDGSRLAFVKEDNGNLQICYLNLPDRTEVCALSDITPSYDPAWSSQGQQFVFASGFGAIAEIFLANVSGGGLVQLTDNEIADLNPTWSPDGQQIAFVSDRDGNFEIYLMDIHDQSLTRLTDHDADDNMPAWSPDGEWLVFISNRDGNYELYKIRSDGSDLTRLTDDPAQDIQPAWWMDR